MKKLILIGALFLFISLNIFSKKDKELKLPINEEGKIVFTEVIETPNINKDNLYSRAYEWFAKTFNSAQNVIQMQDKESGKIIGKGIFDDINVSVPLGMGKVKGLVKFTVSIYLKDGKYKYEVTDLIHEGFFNGELDNPRNGGALEDEKPDCARNYVILGKWKDIKEKTIERVTSLVESLKKAMTIEPASNNW